MKITKNTIIKKLLLSIMLVIMLGNFVMPTRVQADAGGKLAQPIFEFVAWLGDQVLGFLQRTLGNGGDIKNIEGDYAISYSPGNIFANNIAMFDVNFVKPNKYESKVEDGWIQIHSVHDTIWVGGEFRININTLIDKYKCPYTTPTTVTYYNKFGEKSEKQEDVDKERK